LPCSKDKKEEENMFLLYWSEDSDWVAGSDIEGRCYLRYRLMIRAENFRMVDIEINA